MSDNKNLERFITAQEKSYQQAFLEIKNGKKMSHWMWFIFPQIAGLGFSETSVYYAIKDFEEARQYLEHPVLGIRLIEITKAFHDLQGKTANQILGSPDDMKLHSSMTLFNEVTDSISLFREVIDKYFHGKKDSKTMEILNGLHKGGGN